MYEVGIDFKLHENLKIELRGIISQLRVMDELVEKIARDMNRIHTGKGGSIPSGGLKSGLPPGKYTTNQITRMAVAETHANAKTVAAATVAAGHVEAAAHAKSARVTAAAIEAGGRVRVAEIAATARAEAAARAKKAHGFMGHVMGKAMSAPGRIVGSIFDIEMMAGMAETAAAPALEMGNLRTGMRMSRFSPEQIKEAEARAWKVHEDVPTISVQQSMQQIRESASVFGGKHGFDHAITAAPMLAKFQAAIAASSETHAFMKGHEKEYGYDFAKTAELLNLVNNPKEMSNLADHIMKGTIQSGGKLTPRDYLNLVKMSGSARFGTDLNSVMPDYMHFAQAFGASRAGTMFGQFDRAMASGTLTKAALSKLQDMDLLDKKFSPDEKMSAADVSRFVIEHLKNRDLAMRAPGKYMDTVMLPGAAKAAGLTMEQYNALPPDKQAMVIKTATAGFQKNFKDLVTSGMLETKTRARQRETYHKLPGVDDAYSLSRTSPTQAMDAFGKSLGALSTALLGDEKKIGVFTTTISKSADWINKVSSGLTKWNDSLSKAKSRLEGFGNIWNLVAAGVQNLSGVLMGLLKILGGFGAALLGPLNVLTGSGTPQEKFGKFLNQQRKATDLGWAGVTQAAESTLHFFGGHRRGELPITGGKSIMQPGARPVTPGGKSTQKQFSPVAFGKPAFAVPDTRLPVFYSPAMVPNDPLATMPKVTNRRGIPMAEAMFDFASSGSASKKSQGQTINLTLNYGAHSAVDPKKHAHEVHKELTKIQTRHARQFAAGATAGGGNYNPASLTGDNGG